MKTAGRALRVASVLLIALGVAMVGAAFWLQSVLNGFLFIPHLTGLLGVLLVFVAVANLRRSRGGG